MTVDRTALRRLVDSKRAGLYVELASGLADALDELDAKDRRIAELETSLAECRRSLSIAADTVDAYRRRIADLEGACESVRSGAAEAVMVHDAQVARIAELEGQLADERSESDTWFVAGQQISQENDDKISDLELRLSVATESNVNDRKLIAELESALRTALTGWRTNHLCEVDYSDEELARIDELQKLVESEET